MKVVVREQEDGTFVAHPRGHRDLAAGGRDYNRALDALHDLLRARLKAGTLPPELLPGRPARRGSRSSALKIHKCR